MYSGKRSGTNGKRIHREDLASDVEEGLIKVHEKLKAHFGVDCLFCLFMSTIFTGSRIGEQGEFIP